ncbi:MAG: replication initiation protein, partial [Candidatus Poribacteria bacterium]|nr:replication initiation protein [Candidatus Poribacteria bacterium]
MNLAKINEVIKASPAIQIQSRISLLQRRAWNVLLANAYNELPNKEIHSISVGELAAKLGFKDKHSNQDYLKEALRALRSCEVEWNILSKDKEEWGVAGLLAEVRIRDGICFYQFPHTLRLKLHNPRVYAKLNLRLQNRFTSRYALILWEICFDYFDTDRDQGETPFIPLETFKSLMGLEETDYLVFKVLNRDLIKPAIKEINDLTDYLIEVEQKRIGRKVAELKFRITKVKQIPLQESVFPDIENLPPVAI